ncbi:MAG: hypothetical protein ACTINL_01850 [Serratia proteamaculans]|uniref:hypothetical protein n=1 Tax=Serratia marcescens TaxID=615 RepID=UPI001B9CC7C4|nr:hypothetical protein [Serratia marcescens]MBS3894744.1 hypothetical protein [Serratia marcescens]HBC7422229.1 hypothetical protein [Serratia marcescens]
MRVIPYVMGVIIAVFSFTAAARINPAEIEQWRNTGEANQTYVYSGDTTPQDRVVAENKRYAVIGQDAGMSCPAGLFFLADKGLKTYRAVDSGTCDDRNLHLTLGKSTLTFTSQGTKTATYPLP